MAESVEELECDIDLLAAQSVLIPNPATKGSQIDLLLRIEDFVRRVLALHQYRKRIFVLSDLYFVPRAGFVWGERGTKPAHPSEILSRMPARQVMQALTHFFETTDLGKGK